MQFNFDHDYLKSDYAGFFGNFIAKKDRPFFDQVNKDNAAAKASAIVTSPFYVLAATSDDLYACIHNLVVGFKQLANKEYDESKESGIHSLQYFAGFVVGLLVAVLSPVVELISFIGGGCVSAREAVSSYSSRNLGPLTINS